jgi:KUP system potassium uptake protein
MFTWEKGRKILIEQQLCLSPSLDNFRISLKERPPLEVNGQAVFLAANPDRIPHAIVQNVSHNKIIHSDIAILHFKTETVPRVPNFEKIDTEKLWSGFYRIIARNGFMETPKIETVLSLVRGKGIDIKMENTSFFLGRVKLIIGDTPKMSLWQSTLFLTLYKYSMDASSFYSIPSDQVIEVGIQLEI